MTTSDYYTLLALALVTLALLVGPPLVKLFRLEAEGYREIEAAKRRIAARSLARTNLPAVPGGDPDPEEQP